jgi:hypothetical protein
MATDLSSAFASAPGGAAVSAPGHQIASASTSSGGAEGDSPVFAVQKLGQSPVVAEAAPAGGAASVPSISPVPEPGTLVLLLAGVVLLAAAWRRRKA